MRTVTLFAALAFTAGTGCLPLVTTGMRTFEDATSFEVGMTVPIPVAWNPSRMAPEGGGQQRAVCLEVAVEASSPDGDELLAQYCLGIGTYTNYGPLARGQRVWEGVSCGMSTLTYGDDSALGFYVAAGTYHAEWGGIFLRYTFGPDLNYGGVDWATSGLTFAYYWGWIASYLALEIAGN